MPCSGSLTTHKEKGSPHRGALIQPYQAEGHSHHQTFVLLGTHPKGGRVM